MHGEKLVFGKFSDAVDDLVLVSAGAKELAVVGDIAFLRFISFLADRAAYFLWNTAAILPDCGAVRAIENRKRNLLPLHLGLLGFGRNLGGAPRTLYRLLRARGPALVATANASGVLGVGHY